ncbi:MAG TPA: CapA family protein, partial [Ilumatobacteraceae bacterium]|nr:CapA family protein [Ilumatobacteraceae bacterium]
AAGLAASISAGAVAAASSPTQSGPATAAASAVRLAPPLRTLSVVASGDVLTENIVLAAAAREAQPGQRYDFAALMAPIAPAVASADLAICHLELVTGRPGEPAANAGKSQSMGYRLRSPHEVVVGMAQTGFDRCSTASNHSNDLGFGGIVTTLDGLDLVGISHTGTARSPQEAAPGQQQVVVNGVRVAHLSYTSYSNDGAPSQPWQLNMSISPQRVAGDVRAARDAGAEVVIVSLHTFKEMERAPIPADRRFVEQLTAMVPVDLIVQHGPHVIQPIEWVNGALVYWSIGNLLSGMGVAGRWRYDDMRTVDGLLATVRFTETSPGSFVVSTVPLLVCLDPASRVVWPITALDDPATPPSLVPMLQACRTRSRSVIPGL